MTTTDLPPGLHWPIKRSFIRYVARMGDGQILGGHGLRMSDASTFVFPYADSDGDTLFRFSGELRLQAHNGALTLRIANPRLQRSGDRVALVIDSVEGGNRAALLATCELSEQPQSPGAWAGTDVRLAVEAVELFGGYYGEGEVFDDLTVVVPAAATD